MYDGILRTLEDVRHVPKIRKNFISFGVLEFVGYNCTVQGGVLKVSKGILLFMKEKWIRNLYQLEGRNEINKAVVASEGASESTSL